MFNKPSISLTESQEGSQVLRKKIVYFSTVGDLKGAIICKSLEADLEVEEVAPIQADTLLLLGTSFCGIPPEELAHVDMQRTPEE